MLTSSNWYKMKENKGVFWLQYFGWENGKGKINFSFPLFGWNRKKLFSYSNSHAFSFSSIQSYQQFLFKFLPPLTILSMISLQIFTIVISQQQPPSKFNIHQQSPFFHIKSQISQWKVKNFIFHFLSAKISYTKNTQS